MIRRPPRTTPFPDTTLFRSRDLKRPRDLTRELAEEIVARFPFEGTVLETLDRGRLRINLGQAGGRSEEHTSELQSRNISYAVFCLKKKKKIRTTLSCTLPLT